MYWYYPYANINQHAEHSQRDQREERVFSEDLLSRNIGKRVTVYLTFEENREWNARKVTGTLRAVGRDFFVIREQSTGKDQMYLNINIDYFVFEDKPATLISK